MLKRFLFFSILLVFIGQISKAEQYKWGQVTNAEWQLKETPIDTNANAVVLSDVAELDFAYGAPTVFRRHRRIKILKQAGVNEANIQIPYYSKSFSESVNYIKAETFNMDPETKKVEVLPVDEKDIFTIDINENWSAKKFAFPGVKVGSIIEYSYVVESKQFIQLKEWNFQCNLPTIHSEFTAKIDQGFDVKVVYRGFQLPEKYDKVKTSHWELDNLKPIKDEPLYSNAEDYAETIRLQLTGYLVGDPSGGSEYIKVVDGWEAIAKRFREGDYYNTYVKDRDFTQPILKSIVDSSDNALTKAQKIFYYVQKNYTWNNHRDIDPTLSSKEMSDKKVGATSDINMMLVSLLRNSGMDASPVLISTKDNGPITKAFPLLSQFNQLIATVAVDGNTYFLDAANDSYPFGTLPPYDLATAGFKIDRDNFVWIDMPIRGKYKNDSYFKVDFSDSSAATMYLRSQYDGYAAVAMRRSLKKADNDEMFMRKLFHSDGYDWELDSLSIQNKKEIEKPLVLTCYFHRNNGDFATKDRIYLNSVSRSSFEHNPITAPTRILPVDLSYPFEENMVVVYKLPKGFVVKDKPERSDYVLPNGKGTAHFMASTSGVFLNTKLSFTITNSLFSPNEYPTLQQFFNFISQEQDRVYVFEKSGS
ncbi:MAG TPA: DUF3857 domain-containing protein [Williamwhitmania sp.]|nr:DUF3857 domain-containing protein [Williamwhitmania sp.]